MIGRNIMFWKKEKAKEQLLDQKFLRAFEESAKLRDVVMELNTEIYNLIDTIHHKDEIIRQKNDVIKMKDAKINLLEKVIQSGEVVIDEDTKLYSRVYYQKYLHDHLNETFFVLTITLPDDDDYSFIQDIANTILRFTSGTNMTPVLWDIAVIKIFVHVEFDKSQKIKNEIFELLESYAQGKEIRLSFRQFRAEECL